MIASVRGVVTELSRDSIVVDVGGVGLRVFVPQPLLDGLGTPGQEVRLFTHLHVRENELTLFGCQSQDELSLFRLLQTVSGIGPKVAMTVLSTLTPGQLRAAIAQEDVPMLTRIPGIGLKTAKKLVFELKDKVAADLPAGELHATQLAADADLIAALTSLGYSVAEAREAIRSVPPGPLPLEERVRLALQHFPT